mgnify:CR=1 FL=1
MAKHNKKRNVGIIYEQLLSSLSRALVEGKNGKVKIIKGIMVKTTVPRESLAIKILQEAKSASLNLDSKALQREKSLLIKDINHKISNDNFYNQRVQEYKDFATVQSLLNLWSKGDNSSLQQTIKYENVVQEMLLREEIKSSLEDEKTAEVNQLTVKIMLEKFNKKYDNSLSSVQAKIIKEYVFSQNKDSLSVLLREVKEKAIKEIATVPDSHTNKVICEKVGRVKENILSLNEDIHDDENISRFLLLSKLSQELQEDSP